MTSVLEDFQNSANEQTLPTWELHVGKAPPKPTFKSNYIIETIIREKVTFK